MGWLAAFILIILNAGPEEGSGVDREGIITLILAWTFVAIMMWYFL
jgi:hypothetical protein